MHARSVRGVPQLRVPRDETRAGGLRRRLALCGDTHRCRQAALGLGGAASARYLCGRYYTHLQLDQWPYVLKLEQNKIIF